MYVLSMICKPKIELARPPRSGPRDARKYVSSHLNIIAATICACLLTYVMGCLYSRHHSSLHLWSLCMYFLSCSKSSGNQNYFHCNQVLDWSRLRGFPLSLPLPQAQIGLSCTVWKAEMSQNFQEKQNKSISTFWDLFPSPVISDVFLSVHIHFQFQNCKQRAIIFLVNTSLC